MSQVQTSSSFPSTDWSNLDRLNSSEFAEAISTLCQRYWYPVYAFVRQRCGEADRAEDLTQAFFTKVLDKQMFRAADPEKGRFRSYLLT
ncbi:MAG: RNA polymerase sigma factor, partial [Rubripirellula sp.]